MHSLRAIVPRENVLSPPFVRNSDPKWRKLFRLLLAGFVLKK